MDKSRNLGYLHTMSPINMKAVLRQTGIKPDTLRAWERRYQAVTPNRTPSGRRVYTEIEVSRLKLLKELVSNGHSISSVAHLSTIELQKLSKKSLTHSEYESHIAALMAALETFDQKKIKLEITRARFHLSAQKFTFELVPLLMSKVGEKINQQSISVSQEHTFTELIRVQLSQIYESLESINGTIDGANKKTLLFATREGDQHELGLLMSSILCRSRGFNTHYIGANLPAESLREAVIKLKPYAVVIGLSVLPPESEKQSPLKYILALDQLLPSTTAIWCGGNGISLIPKKLTQGKRSILLFDTIQLFSKKLDQDPLYVE